MRKLGRVVRRVLTAVSLLLFVAVLAAWVRGYWNYEVITAIWDSMDDRNWHQSTLKISSADGTLALHLDRQYADAPSVRSNPWIRPAKQIGSHLTTKYFNTKTVESSYPLYFWMVNDAAYTFKETAWRGWLWSRLGVLGCWVAEYRQATVSYYIDAQQYWLAFPCWMAAVVFGALPSWRFIAWWRSRRRRLLALREGRCRGCGYDLRASPLRCPECGLVVGERHEGT